MTETPVREGDILARKYRVDRVLGTGNMGVVVAATHVDLGQRVALKFMLPGKDSGREQRERFLREARASVRLRSQHVARVTDVGTLEDESPYIVMEFLEGRDLAALLKTRGPLPFQEAIEYVLQACEAVAEAHAAGIVHRDLKPANLFLTVDVGGSPCIKVLDFGISKLSDADLTLTQEAQALGSPLYMSPEQMNSSKDVDARSDVWALGTILFQLVAGKTPYHADSVQQLCARVLFGAPTPLAELRPDAPPGLDAVISRCIERDREKRLPNVAALAAALAPFASARAQAYVGRAARALGVAAPPDASIASSPPSSANLNHTVPAVSSPLGTVVMPAPTGRLSSPAIAASSPAVPLAASLGAVASTDATQALTASSPSVTAETATSLTASQLAVPSAAAAAPPKARSMGLILVGAVIAIALPIGFVAFRLMAPRAEPTPAATALPSPSETATAAPSTSAPVVSPAASAAAPASASADASSQPSASATPSAARPFPAAKSPLKPAPTARPTVKGAPAGSYDYDERR